MRLPLRLAVLLWLLATLVAPPAARAQALSGDADPGQQCRRAIAAIERARGIPPGLMAAIARVESGRRGTDGHVDPWPWTINAEGVGQVFDTKPAAIAAVRALQARGIRSIDVGCMQINLMHHPEAFTTLDEAFDPVANIAFAARFLSQLRDDSGSWPAAAALYHSATPALAADYQRKVLAAWPVELAQAADVAPAPAPLPSPVGGRPVGGLTPGGMLGARTFWRGGQPQIIPLAPGRTGLTLAAYRAAPIPLAARLPGPPAGRSG